MAQKISAGQIICVGECMIELARRADDAFQLRVGGDTFNTAIYLARLGAPVSYMTAIGDDPYSAMIVAAALEAGIGIDTITTVRDRLPGLYLIETTEGERRFHYWRDRSPARELFDLADAESRCATLMAADTIYLSGVTLSLYSTQGLDRLAEALHQARRQNGTKVVLDSNYRPAGWRGDICRAREVYGRFWRLTDIALPSFDDEQALWGDKAATDTFARLASFGVPEACLRLAGQGAMISSSQGTNNSQCLIPAIAAKPIDTTAAGDSFSAAYIRARQLGSGLADAADAGNRLAAIVIQHPGAIAPADAMADFAL